MALTADGTVTAWGTVDDNQTNYPPGLTNVVSIAVGDAFCLALKNNGSVVDWGNVSYPAPFALTNEAAVAAGIALTVVLNENGTVAVWGGIILV
jgi:alpha-tubulin suppressor-like RCC1 family protein